MIAGKTVVLVTDRHLYPAREGSQARIVELIGGLRAAGFSVVLIARRVPGRFSERLPAVVTTLKTRLLADRLILVEARHFVSGAPAAYDCTSFRDAVSRAVTRYRPVAVIAEYLWMAPCLDVVPEGTLRLLDAHDLMHARQRIYARHPEGTWVTCSAAEEAQLLDRADIIIAIQKHERQQFQSLMPHKQVLCVPHSCVPHSCFAGARPRRDRPRRDIPGRDVVAFVGSGIQGNLVGLQSFIARSWPLVRRSCRTAELRIFGDVGRRIVADDPSVKRMGAVPTVGDAYRDAKVVINPVTLGTGLKIKTVEALAHGRALVTTSCGAEGIEDGADQAFLLEDDPERFGAAIVRLLDDESLRGSLERGALRFARERFSREAVLRELVAALAARRPAATSAAAVP